MPLQVRVALSIPDDMGFGTEKITGAEERYHLTMKGSIHQEDIAITKVQVPNTRASKYMKPD